MINSCYTLSKHESTGLIQLEFSLRRVIHGAMDRRSVWHHVSGDKWSSLEERKSDAWARAWARGRELDGCMIGVALTSLPGCHWDPHHFLSAGLACLPFSRGDLKGKIHFTAVRCLSEELCCFFETDVGTDLSLEGASWWFVYIY